MRTWLNHEAVVTYSIYLPGRNGALELMFEFDGERLRVVDDKSGMQTFTQNNVKEEAYTLKITEKIGPADRKALDELFRERRFDPLALYHENAMVRLFDITAENMCRWAPLGEVYTDANKAPRD